jgi:hypothetical protein
LGQYGFKVVKPDHDLLVAAGYERVASVPAIFDSEPGYARLPNRFLIDRALGVWDPVARGKTPNPQPPSRTSIKNYADWLCNALEWAEVRGVDLLTADYTTVLIRRYQEEMLKGIWSARGTPLSAGTANHRVQTALDYQTWASDKGYREPFVVPTVTRTRTPESYKNSRSHIAMAVESRKGKVKVPTRTIALPTSDEVHAWLKRIKQEPIVGETHGLMVEHVLNTAIRREELACWRIDTLPLLRKDWKVVNPDAPEDKQQIAVKVEYGAKGAQLYIDEHNDKVSPGGTILVPLWLALRIDAYRAGPRVQALKLATKGVRSPHEVRRILQRSVHLYINPKTGLRYTGPQVYELWTSVEGPEHWHVHAGRHWWACQYLLERVKENEALMNQVLQLTSHEAGQQLQLTRALRGTARTVIQLEIKPQLRHVSSQTTESYLQWLFNQLRVPLQLTRNWQDEE